MTQKFLHGWNHYQIQKDMTHPELSKQKDQVLETGRLNRYVARAGVCSRRNADGLIESGQVRVNGKVVHEYWYNVKKGDQVTVKGKEISPRQFLYILLNKPMNTITTVKDQRGRKTVLDLIEIDGGTSGLFPVGRLDRNTTGALILTSDGSLGHRLMHPSFQVPKQYRVCTKAPVRKNHLDQLQRGIILEDGPAVCDRAVYVQSENLYEIGIELHEGRNRQIRRMLAALDHEVVALERVSYAGLTTRSLRRGKWRELTEKEIRKLYRMVGQFNQPPNNLK
ncbi:MAG: pseudouridine synthase [Bacteroidetes bacterium]|nr:pseudouridine synthase [Bacteroidota bacterium]